MSVPTIAPAPAGTSAIGSRPGHQMSRGSPRAGHLRQIDLVRVLTFGAVIAVHAVALAAAPESVGGNATLTLLHFTREGFFALSGFVLVHAYRDRALRPVAFWRKRIPPVALPYLTWSLLFVLLHRLLGTSPLPSPREFLHVLLAGGSEYHLYFLLVTLQVYLLLPALLGLLRRTRGWHVPLLSVSLLLQVATSAFLQYGTPGGGPARFYLAHGYELLPSYQFWVLLGALAAVHLDRLQVVVDRYARPLMAASIVALIGGQVGYRVAVGSGTAPSVASSVFQPFLVPLFAVTIVLLYVAGSRWAGRVAASPDRPAPRFVVAASQASFGIYLVHPAVLDLLARPAAGLPTAVAVVVLWVVAAAASAVFVTLARFTPLSLALCGRPRRRVP
jgi:peptidoglycan/LPS O-acetylase OafA/YrhL